MSVNPSNLFRQQAIEQSHNRLSGNVILINAPSFTFVSWFLLGVIALSLGFVSEARFSAYESVDGLLKSAGSALKVYPKEQAVITDLRVHEGQMVEVGDKLMTLRASESRVKGQSDSELEKKELERQLDTLKTKREMLASSYQLQRQKLALKIDNTNRNIDTLSRKVELLGQRRDILKHRYEDQKKVSAQGNISQTEVEAARLEYLAIQETMNDRQAEIDTAKGQLKQYRFDLEALPVNRKLEVAGIDNDISQLKKQLIKLDSQIEYTLQATQAGIVSNIVALQGEVVNPNFPLLTIAEQKSELTAELYVPSRAIGFIEPGLKVYVRFDAFPHQYYGDIEGEVYEVSKVLLFPSEWPNPLGLKVPVYRVRVRLKSDSIVAAGEAIRLQKGLRLNADIVLEEKTVLDYLLSPIIDIKNKMH